LERAVGAFLIHKFGGAYDSFVCRGVLSEGEDYGNLTLKTLLTPHFNLDFTSNR